jgi:arachidonate 5-lipoxygenase
MKTEPFSIWLLIRRAPRKIFDKLVLWLYAKAFGLMLALFLCFPKRQRMSHNNGIAATGAFRVVDDPTFPEHEFFSAGREFPVRIRHASATFLDDAMNCIRSLSIKLSHHHFKSPFDIEMNTGETSLFWSAVSFLKFGSLRKEQYGVEYRDYNRQYPDGLRGSQKAGRRHASSFHNLRYYTKTPFYFIGTDGIVRYAKYRALPADGEPETGINENPSEWDQCNQRILPHETRGRNYLKYEYEDRIAREGARYRLQVQTHPASDNEDPEVFNNMVLWDEEAYPWHDLGIIEIDKTLDWKESTLTTFSVNNMPRSLGVIPAKSIYDYNSLNYLRAHSEIARKARLLSYKVFGMVPPIPDNDNRNFSDWGS